ALRAPNLGAKGSCHSEFVGTLPGGVINYKLTSRGRKDPGRRKEREMGNPCVRPIGALAALTAFLALSSLATAQQPGLPGQERPLTTHPDRPEAVKVWVTGNFSLDY